MEIGFIGYSAFSGPIADSLRQAGHSVCGVYHSRKAELDHNMKEYPSAESLISGADLVYVAKDELPLFEISKIAIKEAKNLFFESPFVLDQEAFRHLFHLACESKSIIRFSQKMLAHPVYRYVRPQLDPLFINFRVDAHHGHKTFDQLSSTLFDIVSIVWETVHRDLRKMNYLPLEYNTRYPGTFFFDMNFDSGTHVNLLFNHFTREAGFQAEFIQASKRIFLDFVRPELMVYDKTNGASWLDFEEPGGKQHWIVEDFRRFVINLNEGKFPLTINEDNQEVLFLTRSLLNEMQHKAQLLA